MYGNLFFDISQPLYYVIPFQLVMFFLKKVVLQAFEQQLIEIYGDKNHLSEYFL
jgi:hypothetical protein